MSDFLKQIDPNSLESVVLDLQQRVAMLEGRTISGVTTLDSITDDFGLVQAGEFRTGTGEPENGFSGVRMAYPAMDYLVGGSTMSFNVVGVNNDTLQFGLDAASGAAVAGAGAVTINSDGIMIEASPDEDVWVEPNSYSFHAPVASDTPGGSMGGMAGYVTDDGVTRGITLRVSHPGNSDGYAMTRLRFLLEAAGINTLEAVYDTGVGSGGKAWFDLAATETDVDFYHHGDLYLYGSVKTSTPLGCLVYRSTAQSLTANVGANLAWNTQVTDTDACWASGEPTILYAKHDGYYMAGGGFRIDSFTGHLTIYVMRNNSDYLVGNRVYYSSAVGLISVNTGMFYLAANEYVVIQATCTSNATITAAAANNTSYNYGYLFRIA
jgi:hypothetical protein